MVPDRLLAWRDRLLADRRFQRWAVRFPLTRGIARRRTRSLFDLCAGFVYAQTLTACVQLRLFDQVADTPMTCERLAVACAMPPAAMASLLQAATALRLLQPRRSGAFGLGPQGAALRANPALIGMITHHAMLYEDLRDPVALLRRPQGDTRLAQYWPYAGAPSPTDLPASDIDAYTALMATSQPLIADEVLAAYDFARHATLLDVGGGDGSFLAAVSRRAPALRLMLVDLPQVAALAQAKLGPAARCTGADFRTDPLPAGADIVSFVRVLHDHDDTTVRHLLRAAHAALPAGGTVLIAEPMADDPSAAAYFALYLHAMGSGRPRTAADLGQMLQTAGFERPHSHPTPTPLLTSVLTARASRV